jgi:hypothetical protein
MDCAFLGLRYYLKMRYFLGCLLILAACNTPPPVETEREPRIEASDIAPNTSNVSSIYTYFLIPSQALLDAEYDNLRNNLENLGTPESQLQRMAFEGAVGMIASMLDTKYGEHVQGEILPSSRVMIIKADQELDLLLLKDLIVDLEEND